MITLKSNIIKEFTSYIEHIKDKQSDVIYFQHLNPSNVGQEYIDCGITKCKKEIEEITEKLLHQIAVIAKERYVEGHF